MLKYYDKAMCSESVPTIYEYIDDFITRVDQEIGILVTFFIPLTDKTKQMRNSNLVKSVQGIHVSVSALFSSTGDALKLVFLARDVIYTSRAYATMSVSVCLSVRLSVTGVHWRIIANLRFKFRSKFTAHCRSGEGSSQQQHLALC